VTTHRLGFLLSLAMLSCGKQSDGVADKKPTPAQNDLSCATKADCRVVKESPCDKCGCASKPVAARFETPAPDCTKAAADTRVCGECRGFIADCVGGRCVATPEP
jgi:hypothetical protein